MSKTYLALGPTGFGPHTLDPQTGTLAPSTGTAEHLLIPGLVDIHVHGGYGIDFMSSDVEGMTRLCRKFEAEGYEGFLPTTVTASVADVKRALASLPNDPMILGFHLEGPFISQKYPGAQPPSAILNPPEGPSEWDEILDDPRLRVVTLAGELPGAPALIRRLSERGIRVSLGHTDATFAQATVALEAGAAHTTHTYNAMRPLHHREAGMVGFALATDAIACELIYDRLHVSREAAAVLVRAKPHDKLIAISDGTMAGGLPAGQTLRMWGLDCVVGAGQVRLTDGTLAGSAITLMDAFRNLHADFGPEVAIRACCHNPRRTLSMDPWTPRVWVELDAELRIADRFKGNRHG